MADQPVVVRFDNVTFKYNDKKITLDGADFTVRKNAKMTIMGQNGAGKSTIFKLLTGVLQPTSGKINIELNSRIGIAEQMIPQEKLGLSVLQYFESAFAQKVHGIESNIRKVLQAVNLEVALDKKVSDLSGGQKARLMLAYALIQDPDILLLDEPTNNLDPAGIEHLTQFLIDFPKTCLVISHDANFLNSFTDGVLNLDVHTHKVDQFVGNYYDVVEQINAQIERERLQNARLEKSIKDRFEKINKLGGKSVQMRRLAVKVREDIDVDRENMVEIRREDKTLGDFLIPNQEIPGRLMLINKVGFLHDGKPVSREVNVEIYKGHKVLISGRNGIGKSTLLKALLNGEGAEFRDDLRIGYYSQDFSELNFEHTALESLQEVSLSHNPQEIYGAAGRFMLTGELLQNKVGSLSEGQKGLLCYARFMLQEPGLLIMDEPTNHINFRHIPVIAKALNDFKGGMILISHLPEFLWQVQIDQEIDLEKV